MFNQVVPSHTNPSPATPLQTASSASSIYKSPFTLAPAFGKAAQFATVPKILIEVPSAPAAPCGPAAPVDPAGPVGPVAPGAPLEPGAPGAPGAPLLPGIPCAPSTPSAPAGPATPEGPCAPCGPCIPLPIKLDNAPMVKFFVFPKLTPWFPSVPTTLSSEDMSVSVLYVLILAIYVMFYKFFLILL